MQKYNKKQNNEDTPYLLYVIVVAAFFLLVFTIMSLFTSDNSPIKLQYANNIKMRENLPKAKPDIIDKAIKKIDNDSEIDDFSDAYNQYRKEQLRRNRQEFRQRQKLYRKLEQDAKRQKLAQKRPEKHNMTIDPVKRKNNYTPVREIRNDYVREPIIEENALLNNAMRKSPCSKESITAIAYFFSPNSYDPVELIFNDPSPGFNNHGKVKFIFGDISNSKRQIYKDNMSNLNEILNRPQFSSNTSEYQTRRSDAGMKIMSGVTTNCSPYVYQSDNFYLSKVPPSAQTAYSSESYCTSNNARLPDPIELIPVLMTGRLPSGLYWTSGKVLKTVDNISTVNRSSLSRTNSLMLIDFSNQSLGFISQQELSPNSTAYSVCVIDE